MFVLFALLSVDAAELSGVDVSADTSVSLVFVALASGTITSPGIPLISSGGGIVGAPSFPQADKDITIHKRDMIISSFLLINSPAFVLIFYHITSYKTSLSFDKISLFPTWE